MRKSEAVTNILYYFLSDDGHINHEEIEMIENFLNEADCDTADLEDQLDLLSGYSQDVLDSHFSLSVDFFANKGSADEMESIIDFLVEAALSHPSELRGKINLIREVGQAWELEMEEYMEQLD